jgi:hypothetical protein
MFTTIKSFGSIEHILLILFLKPGISSRGLVHLFLTKHITKNLNNLVTVGIAQMTAKVFFTKEKLDDLIKAHKQAVDQKKDSFLFDGQEYLTSYAKYIIEYLKSKFPKT